MIELICRANPGTADRPCTVELASDDVVNLKQLSTLIRDGVPEWHRGKGFSPMTLSITFPSVGSEQDWRHEASHAVSTLGKIIKLLES